MRSGEGEGEGWGSAAALLDTSRLRFLVFVGFLIMSMN